MKTKQLVMASMFTALIAVGAFIKIPVPVCPFTLQFLFTTLAGALLGGGLGAVSVLCYIALGLIGLPVFSSGGGIGYIFQPTFGYLIGFAVGAFVTGKIIHSGSKLTFPKILAGNFIGLLIVYLCGMAYYWVIAQFYTGEGIGFKTLFLYCFVLAVPGDIVLCFISSLISKKLIPIMKKENLYV